MSWTAIFVEGGEFIGKFYLRFLFKVLGLSKWECAKIALGYQGYNRYTD